MNKNRRMALLGSLVGGSIIRVYHTGKWVDYRGNVYDDAEIQEATDLGVVTPVPVVNAVELTKEQLEAFVKGKKIPGMGKKGETR
jgi:hypothetical protein